MVSFLITTTCHAQTTDTQTIRVEATIGPWSTSGNGNEAGTKEKPTITIPPSDSGSSAKLPQTSEQVKEHMMLLGLLLSIFSLIMLITVNREDEYAV